jgi:hypothetical protein
VSPSLVACPAMISFFTVVLSGTLLPLDYLLRYVGIRPARDSEEPCQGVRVIIANADDVPQSGQPPEGAANQAG